MELDKPQIKLHLLKQINFNEINEHFSYDKVIGPRHFCVFENLIFFALKKKIYFYDFKL